MPPDIALLRRIAEGSDTPADRAVLAGRLRDFFAEASRGASLDAVFGLAPVAGRVSWWRAEALTARDAALRALAERFHAGASLRQQSAAIHSALVAYAASAWRHDRSRSTPPARYVGTPREILFDALRACDVVPSARHIRRVIGDR